MTALLRSVCTNPCIGSQTQLPPAKSTKARVAGQLASRSEYQQRPRERDLLVVAAQGRASLEVSKTQRRELSVSTQLGAQPSLQTPAKSHFHTCLINCSSGVPNFPPSHRNNGTSFPPEMSFQGNLKNWTGFQHRRKLLLPVGLVQ